MLNGQLKAGYNISKTGRKPTNLIADAGYGSTYNYLCLKWREINNVKIELGLISIAHNIRKLFKLNKGKILPYFLYLLNNSFKNSHGWCS